MNPPEPLLYPPLGGGGEGGMGLEIILHQLLIHWIWNPLRDYSHVVIHYFGDPRVG